MANSEPNDRLPIILCHATRLHDIANSITRIVKLILKPLQQPHFTSKVLISPK